MRGVNSRKRVIDLLVTSYGISKKSALYFCFLLGLNAYSCESIFTGDHQKQINKFRINKNIQDSDLMRFNKEHINLKKKIRCYQGIRHIQGLPVRGQNTKTNARTSKNRKLSIR